MSAETGVRRVQFSLVATPVALTPRSFCVWRSSSFSGRDERRKARYGTPMNDSERSATALPATSATDPATTPKTRFGNEAIAPYFFVVLFAVAFLAVGYILLPFLGDMVIALLFVILLTPAYNRLVSLLRGKEVLASGLMVVVLIALGAVPIFLVASALL